MTTRMSTQRPAAGQTKLKPKPADVAIATAPHEATALLSTDPRALKRGSKRDRSKQELAYLREHVLALEQQLFNLQQQQPQPDERDAGARGACSSTISAARLWEKISQGQREERRRAEVANAKLRELLEGQLKVATSLERILHKRPNKSWIESFRLDGDTAKRLRVDNESDADSFEALMKEIPALYAQADATLAETGMGDRTAEFRDVQVKWGSRGIFMEYLDANLLPFDLATAAAAVWQFASSPRTDFANGSYEVIEATADTVRAQFRASLQFRRTQVALRVNIVMRKVVEADRVVVVWCTAGTSEGPLLGSRRIRLRERGLTVATQLSPSPRLDATGDGVGEGGVDRVSCLFQMVLRSAPELQEAASPDEHEQAGVLTDLIVGSYLQNMRVIWQLVENFVMVAHLSRAVWMTRFSSSDLDPLSAFGWVRCTVRTVVAAPPAVLGAGGRGSSTSHIVALAEEFTAFRSYG
ncbi:hypothetical protein PybrP1_011269 [[Pythium] brassicae (nom. inval.)]|nr:hypothetical protein PybrP1_011269 [[Pythium] brassicae (nom. inval.)]